MRRGTHDERFSTVPHLMAEFPGPLTPQTNREKLAQLIAAHSNAAAQERWCQQPQVLQVQLCIPLSDGGNASFVLKTKMLALFDCWSKSAMWQTKTLLVSDSCEGYQASRCFST